jgi:hypothetical protein
MTLTDLPSNGDHRMVSADVRVNPPDLISNNPEWVSILAWQGGLANQRGLVIDNLDRVGPGHYRSTQPIPVWGNWKTLLRVQDGRMLTAAPIYLAADPGIGIPEVPALSTMTRPFVHEVPILQRERSPQVPAVLWTAGCLIVLVCTLILFAALTWGAGRINNSETSTGAEAERRPTVQA